MKKSEAKELLGGTLTRMGAAINRGKSALSQWPDDLTDDQINLVVGAAVRKGVRIPDDLMRRIAKL